MIMRAQNQVSGGLLARSNFVLLAKDRVESFDKYDFYCKHDVKLDKKFFRNKGILYCKVISIQSIQSIFLRTFRFALEFSCLSVIRYNGRVDTASQICLIHMLTMKKV